MDGVSHINIKCATLYLHIYDLVQTMKPRSVPFDHFMSGVQSTWLAACCWMVNDRIAGFEVIYIYIAVAI